MAEPDVWRCSRCGWEYPNKHPNAKHRRNHKKKCVKLVKAAEAGVGVEAAAPGGSSSDDALSDGDQQEEHQAIASSNGSMAAPHPANTHIEAAGTATGGDGEQDGRTLDDIQANVGHLGAGDEGKAGHHQNRGGPEHPDGIQEDGHVGTSAVNDDPAELEIKEPDSVASAVNEAVEQTALPKLPEDKGDPVQDSQEVGEIWELLLEAEEQGQEHASTASSNEGMGAPHSADPHREAPKTATVGEGTVSLEKARAFQTAAAEEQSSAVASKLLEDKGDEFSRDAAKAQSLENQEVRELWEQLLEADLAVKNNVNNQITGFEAAPVAPVTAPSEAQQIQPVQQSVIPVPTSVDGGFQANGTNPFVGDGRQQPEQPQSSKESGGAWKAFPTDDEDNNNGPDAVVNPFVGTEGFRASKVDESDIKPHVALHALFKNDVKRAEGDDFSPLVDEESEAWVKSSKNSSSKKPRFRWSSFICCGSRA